MDTTKKTCTKCGLTKLVSCFSKDITKKDNLSTVCKGCRVKTDKLYREKNREKVLQRKKIYMGSVKPRHL